MKSIYIFGDVHAELFRVNYRRHLLSSVTINSIDTTMKEFAQSDNEYSSDSTDITVFWFGEKDLRQGLVEPEIQPLVESYLSQVQKCAGFKTIISPLPPSEMTSKNLSNSIRIWNLLKKELYEQSKNMADIGFVDFSAVFTVPEGLLNKFCLQEDGIRLHNHYSPIMRNVLIHYLYDMGYIEVNRYINAYNYTVK